MRLVLLPGLNGSSHLFAPLIDELQDIDCQALSLPDHGPQDYDSLADMLIQHLLAYRLALRNPEGLRGVIFAASFLSNPFAPLALLRHLPIPLALATRPWMLRTLCLGDGANEETLRLVQGEIRRLDRSLLRARLASLATLHAPQQRLALPTLHLWPQQDRLVTPHSAKRLAEHCDDLRQVRLKGPHFILQTQARACAAAIRTFMAEQAPDETRQG
jgi:pimeloyl-ACP methyl ester carboxylesterase